MKIETARRRKGKIYLKNTLYPAYICQIQSRPVTIHNPTLRNYEQDIFEETMEGYTVCVVRTFHVDRCTYKVCYLDGDLEEKVLQLS